MAKRKRKLTAAQRDKSIIETAKYLKHVGVLSKSAKLHSGRYVSRAVAKKAKEYGFVFSNDYTTIKAPKKVVERAKELGYTVVNKNHIIAPKDRRYRNAIMRGEPGGVVPVKLGVMEVIPVTSDLMTLTRLIEDTDELENMKAPGEVFAFRFMGNMGYQTSPNAEKLRQDLSKYLVKIRAWATTKTPEEMADEPEALVLFRLNPSDTRAYIANREERAKMYRGQKRYQNDRRAGPKPGKSRAEMLPAKATRLREEDRVKHQKQRAAWGEERKAAERVKSKARMQAYRDKLKRGK